MKNFSFFEVAEEDSTRVVKALNRGVKVNGRKVVVEIADESDAPNDRKKKSVGEKGRKAVAARGGKDFTDVDPFEKFQKKSKKKQQQEAQASRKPSREERGYTAARGPKKKDDWKQFFQHDERPLRGPEPDFNEEGWARRVPKKK